MTTDPIAAIATPAGRGGVGIVRLSGPSVAVFVDGLIGRALPPRRAVHVRFSAADGSALDDGIAIHFPAPASFTGEDVLELHGHGGPVVMRLLLERCLELGARLAMPGEFSRRAFLNDRIDLAQAEAIADLIDASTAAAARAAVRSLSGEFSARVGALRDALVRLRMYTEATLDFPEEDIEFVRAADASGQLDRLASGLDALLQAARSGSALRDGIHVVLLGRPNVGKSSLLNCLAGEDVAIVTPVPGTTRDAIRQAIEIDGVPLHLVDTAGLRETEDTVEKIGIERTWAAAHAADIALLLVDAREGVGEAEREILARLPAGTTAIIVHNKIDLAGRSAGMIRRELGDESPDHAGPAVTRPGEAGVGPAAANRGAASELWLSAKTGEGIGALRAELLRLAGYAAGDAPQFLARVRHVDALRRARERIAAARGHLIAAAPALELFAEELRLAHEALGEITGKFTADELLGEIFSRFCIGK